MIEWFQDFVVTLAQSETWVQYLGTFLISVIPFFESYVAIPIGIVFGFPSIQVVAIAAVGNWLSVMVFIWLLSGLRKKVVKNKDNKRKNRAQKIFNKYGVAGISFAGPIICFHVCAAISIASGAKKAYVSIWQAIGIGA
ncbi:small multi-drug export protein [Gracilibacillus phocaeensis]|uniref:small multi-drug export protein n=1 Tax=Gracilibacillus phocaeensis TaxID=2042304 RepID=UPI00103063D4|nr:small multi-drug export protein [Gracilibacillus phocaeensis]